MGFHPIWNWDYGITPVLKLGLRDYGSPPMGALLIMSQLWYCLCLGHWGSGHWWSKHRQYRSWGIIREPRRECRKDRHYLVITLPTPLPEREPVYLNISDLIYKKSLKIDRLIMSCTEEDALLIPELMTVSLSYQTYTVYSGISL